MAQEERTSSRKSAVSGLSIGTLQAPHEQLHAPRWQPVLASVELFQPLFVLVVQIILYEALIMVSHPTCKRGYPLHAWR
jgi:hypothetical protein